jgi:hypothetical protein
LFLCSSVEASVTPPALPGHIQNHYRHSRYRQHVEDETLIKHFSILYKDFPKYLQTFAEMFAKTAIKCFIVPFLCFFLFSSFFCQLSKERFFSVTTRNQSRAVFSVT